MRRYLAFLLTLLLALLLLGKVSAQTPVVHSVSLAWDAPSSLITGGTYNVYRADVVGGVCGTFSKVNTVAISGLTVTTSLNITPGASYCFQVTYFDPSTSSESAPSNQVIAGPIPATVALAPPANLHLVKMQ